MPATCASARAPGLALWGLGLLICALWMLARPYLGIAHDGAIYALFAMARLHPQSLGHDFFVLNGAQDHFTVFSPLYAAAIRLLGLDQATALAVLITQAVFLYAAWVIARRFIRPDLALLSLALLVLLPSLYGDRLVFSSIEMFPTPRQPAEAATLLGIGCILQGRPRLATVCLLISALLHPIIAAAGIAFWFVLAAGMTYPGRALAVLAIAIALCWIITFLPHGPLRRFDPEWLLNLQERQPFLFPTRWDETAWGWSLPGLATLLTGALRTTDPAVRRLCIGAVLSAAAGVALSIIGGDVLHLVVATQMQMWRWLWLPGVLAAVMLPGIVRDAGESGTLGRAAVLLLVAGWLASQPSLKLALSILAVLCAGTRHPFTPPIRNMILAGACCVMLAVFYHLGTDILSQVGDLPNAPMGRDHLATRIAQFKILSSNTVLSMTTVLAVWYLGRITSRRGAALLALLGIAACVATLPYAISTWARTQYPCADQVRFQPWRQIIPAAAAVLWPDSPPLAAWYCLHRASYWSMLQMYGLVFSRRELEIGAWREKAVQPWMHSLGGQSDGPPSRASGSDAAAALASLCTTPDLAFVASWRNLGPTPYPAITTTHPGSGASAPLYLYRCEHRGT